jgi:hypothetical protein
MPYSEFIEWQMYYAIEPFGAKGDQYRTGTLIAATVGKEDTNWRTFFPDHFGDDPVVEQDTDPDGEKQRAMMKLMCSVYGGTWKEGGDDIGSSRATPS